jgi:predicted nucleotidyltransferase
MAARKGGRHTEEDATRFAERLAAACSRALGNVVEGVVLHGSLAVGGFAPGRSDIDLLVIVARQLADAEAVALTDALAAGATEAPVRVDLRIVTRDVAASPTPTPPVELAIEMRPGRDRPFRVERRHPGERDLAVELSLCRAIGRSLVGEPATRLIGDVPADWVVAAGDAQLADWIPIGNDPPRAQLTVLTACRIWRFADEHHHCSKTAAAEWALERDPSLNVIHTALRQRDGDPATTIDPLEVQRLLHLVREQLASLQVVKEP